MTYLWMPLMLLLAGAREPAMPAAEARGVASSKQVSTKETSDAVIAQVVQAIEDEIYDYKREGLFFEVDGNPGGDTTPATISVHVSKSLSADGVGVAVYDLMPLGQVYRYFAVDSSGLVRLSGDPERISRNGGGSFLTLYMRTDELCEFIASRSKRSTFTVDPNVSPERVRAAVKRQLQRTGFSFREDPK